MVAANFPDRIGTIVPIRGKKTDFGGTDTNLPKA
jgi:hypothetical protein